MDFNGGSSCNSATTQSELEADMDLRRGPWTVEEDLLLMNYIASHGEGRWNSLARCAGLKRTGKSCRLRWLNYLRPDVRRGNITLEEQLMILELHSRWGNRWSKIAQHLPGRTDNEIKNYWRTRVQKHAKQLQCDVNSKQFKDTMKYLWMPRLVERIQAAASASSAGSTITSHHQSFNGFHDHQGSTSNLSDAQINNNHSSIFFNNNHNPEISSREEASSDCSDQGTQISTVSDYNNNSSCTTTTNLLVNDSTNNNIMYNTQNAHYNYPDTLISPTGYFNQASGMGFQGSVDQQLQQNNGMWLGGDGVEGISDNLWNVEDDMWF